VYNKTGKGKLQFLQLRDGSGISQVVIFRGNVSDEEFDAIFQRIQEAGITWGSEPRSPTNRQLNTRKGGRGVYFHGPDGHLLELLTRP
ncbi:MAG: OB-fold nucleic acid binding domain-containing protein, partial [Candidatus Binatia bacterium]